MILHHINGAATGKTCLFEQALHDDIVTVGVDAQMRALSISPIQTEHADSFFRTVRRETMHNAVRTGIQPCAVCDFPVGRFDIRPVCIEKRAEDFSCVIYTDITVAAPH